MSIEEVKEQVNIDKGAFNEMGTVGLNETYGWINEDPVPKLSGLRNRMKIYKKMTHDPIVGAILFAIEMHLRRANWHVETQDGEKDDNSEFVAECLDDMSHTFQDFLSEVLSMLPYGFSVHEIVYKYRDDGKIGWKKLPIRSQDSIQKWEFDDKQELRGVWQYDQNMSTVYIPVEKFLLFRPNSYKNNPEGRGVLRNAYRPYYFKRKIEVIEAIGIERDLSGYPVLNVPIDIFAKNDLAQSQRDYAKKLVTRVRKDEQMGAVLPPGWELELLSTSGGKNVNTGEIINRYNLQIAQSLLSDIIMLGHTRAGSYALSEKKYELFVIALDSWLDSIQEVMNRVAIPRLMELNGETDRENYPLLRHDPVSKIDPQKLANVLFRLIKVNAIQADKEMELFLRNYLGLPVKDTETQEDYPNPDMPDETGRMEQEANETRPADSTGEYSQQNIDHD